jgi:catechol 2,3-dioxygenase-like lactoylglutathione lyase family enzyme
MLKGLHHNAYRCRDSEETRKFYEGFLGLPLSATLEINETKTGRSTATLHTFYRLDDGSFLAFFEAPDMPFEFKVQHDYDLHIALEVEYADLAKMLEKGQKAGIVSRGISDHGFIWASSGSNCGYSRNTHSIITSAMRTASGTSHSPA